MFCDLFARELPFGTALSTVASLELDSLSLVEFSFLLFLSELLDLVLGWVLDLDLDLGRESGCESTGTDSLSDGLAVLVLDLV